MCYLVKLVWNCQILLALLKAMRGEKEGSYNGEAILENSKKGLIPLGQLSSSRESLQVVICETLDLTAFKGSGISLHPSPKTQHPQKRGKSFNTPLAALSLVFCAEQRTLKSLHVLLTLR